MKKNTRTLEQQQQTGHVYIVDLKACAQAYGWLLTAVLLHKQSIASNQFKYPQYTSMATLEIKSSTMHAQALCIQRALQDGKCIHAQVAFNHLRLLEETADGMPNTAAELLELNHMVIEYRRGSNPG